MALNLELVTTVQLLDEIQNRYSHFIFVGQIDHGKHPDGSRNAIESSRWNGEHRICQGMGYAIMARIDKHWDECQEADQHGLSEEDL